MATISLCMIVKNEEQNIAQCLSSMAGAVDEIIIADTGSTDGTVDIARRFTDKIHHFEWINDFAAARNFAFSHGGMDYLMWLDADDILTPANRDKLIALKRKLTADVVTAGYHYTHDEHGNATLVSIRERLIKRALFGAAKWNGAVHEGLLLPKNFSGKVLHSDIFVTHTKNHPPSDVNGPSFKRNFAILEQSIGGGNYSPNDMYYFAVSLKALRRNDEALTWMQKYLQLPEARSNVDAYLAVHDIFLEKGDLAAAQDILVYNEAQNCHMSEYYTNLGRFFQKNIGDLQKAAAAYANALKCTGITQSGTRAESLATDYYYFLPHMGLGEIATAAGDFKAALAHYEIALKYKPGDQTAVAIVGKLRQIVTLSTGSNL